MSTQRFVDAFKKRAHKTIPRAREEKSSFVELPPTSIFLCIRVVAGFLALVASLQAAAPPAQPFQRLDGCVYKPQRLSCRQITSPGCLRDDIRLTRHKIHMNPAILKKCGVVSKRHSSMRSVQPVDLYQSVAARVIESPHNRRVVSRRQCSHNCRFKIVWWFQTCGRNCILLCFFPVIVRCK